MIFDLYVTQERTCKMICGIDIKSNEAIIVLCDTSKEMLAVSESKFKKIALDSNEQDLYKSFYETLLSFIKQYTVEKIYLKKPVDKGRQTAGANAFRIEAIINLIEIPVVSLHANTLLSFSKKNKLNVENIEKVNQYQLAALWAAYWGFIKEED